MIERDMVDVWVGVGGGVIVNVIVDDCVAVRVTDVDGVTSSESDSVHDGVGGGDSVADIVVSAVGDIVDSLVGDAERVGDEEGDADAVGSTVAVCEAVSEGEYVPLPVRVKVPRETDRLSVAVFVAESLADDVLDLVRVSRDDDFSDVELSVADAFVRVTVGENEPEIVTLLVSELVGAVDCEGEFEAEVDSVLLAVCCSVPPERERDIVADNDHDKLCDDVTERDLVPDALADELDEVDGDSVRDTLCDKESERDSDACTVPLDDSESEWLADVVFDSCWDIVGVDDGLALSVASIVSEEVREGVGGGVTVLVNVSDLERVADTEESSVKVAVVVGDGVGGGVTVSVSVSVVVRVSLSSNVIVGVGR